MSEKKGCCLCCSPSINEYKFLQNDSGEYNEIYEIIVKYFDPMLITDDIDISFSTKSSVLCQNCWIHIKDFNDFYQTVLNARASFERISIQNSPLQIKVEEEQVTNLFNSDYDDDAGCEELTQTIKSDWEYRNHLEEDIDVLSDSDDEIPLDKLRRTCDLIQKEDPKSNLIDKAKRNLKEKAISRKERKLKINFNESKIIGCEDVGDGKNIQRKAKKFKDSDRLSNLHPVLDKGREYDKFIAEWKSELECDICSESFPIFDLLKVHFKDKHNVRCFVKCCDRKFDRRCSLVEHIRLHINPEMHKCDICGKLSGSKYSLIHHKKTIHEESQKFKCNQCPKIFKQKQNLKSHLLTHVTGSKDFKCRECDRAYVLESQLKKHIKLVHIDNRICDQCGKTLHGIGALKNHLKEHTSIEKPKYPCDECGAELGSRITLKRHKASYHNDGSTIYVCSLCGKVSSTERALKNHKKYVHEIERKYKCPNCDKAFKRSQNLQEHIATHTGEALYQCPQCPRSFKINSKYHEHRKKAHPIEWEEGRKNRLEKQKIDYERVTNQVVI